MVTIPSLWISNVPGAAEVGNTIGLGYYSVSVTVRGGTLTANTVAPWRGADYGIAHRDTISGEIILTTDLNQQRLGLVRSQNRIVTTDKRNGLDQKADLLLVGIVALWYAGVSKSITPPIV